MSGIEEKGSIAVVTRPGIGRALAAELASHGFIVVATHIDEKVAERTAEAIGGESHVLDVTDSAATLESSRTPLRPPTVLSTSWSPTLTSRRCSPSWK